MAYCPYCGADAADSFFCPNCGARFDSDSVEAGRSTNPYEAGTKPPSKRYAWFGFIDAAIVLGFWETIDLFFRKALDFRGRANRAEFWSYASFSFLYALAAGFCENELFENGGLATEICVWLATASVTVRRFHDSGKSGWNYLCVAVPIFLEFGYIGLTDGSSQFVTFALLGLVVVGWIYAFILLVLKSTPGANAYGPELKKRP